MKLTVVICARNESANLASLFKSLKDQDFQHNWEVVFIDDFSTDDTPAMLNAFCKDFTNAQVVNLSDIASFSPYTPNKKQGIEWAVSIAKATWVVLTDADCTFGSGWLKRIHLEIEKANTDVICGPVMFYDTPSFFSKFILLDQMAMMALTKWTVEKRIPVLANGANLIFNKDTFLSITPYGQNQHIYSGDDVFLLQSFLSNRGRVIYLQDENSIVRTHSPASFSEFVHQRIRWASKSVTYKNGSLIVGLVCIYIFNLLLLLMAIATLWLSSLRFPLLILFIIKMALDTIIILPQAQFFKKKSYLWLMPLAECFHICYVVFFGLLSLSNTYTWKGRKVTNINGK
jgi:glycosyltransferase involved in cell wall biosynthesis